MSKADVIIIGGGAAGIFAAINIGALNPNLKVVVLEKTTKLLSNILISQSGSAAATILLYKLIICTLCFSMVVFYLLSIWLTSKYAGIPGAAAALVYCCTMKPATGNP